MKIAKRLLLLLLVSTSGTAVLAQPVTLKAFEVLELPSEVTANQARLQIHAFGRDFAMALTPNRDLLASLPATQRARVARDTFLKGKLEGVPDSWVRLNRIDGRISGGFFDGSELYLIDRAKGFSGIGVRGLTANDTIVFRFSDLDFRALVDHGGVEPLVKTETGRGQTDYQNFISHLREVASLQGTAMLAMPVTIVSDTQFTSQHGSSAASVVVGRINFIDGIYSSQLGVGITLWHHEILSSNGTLTATDALELLNQFRTFMTNGAGSEIPFEGLAHLFTDTRPAGGTAGIAYVGVLCNRFSGYGVDEDLNSETTSALVFAHEVGHNFNAPHDGQEGEGQQGACADETFAGIMNPFINGVQQFSDCSLAQMEPAAADASCLVETIDSQLVFADGFE